MALLILNFSIFLYIALHIFHQAVLSDGLDQRSPRFGLNSHSNNAGTNFCNNFCGRTGNRRNGGGREERTILLCLLNCSKLTFNHLVTVLRNDTVIPSNITQTLNGMPNTPVNPPQRQPIPAAPQPSQPNSSGMIKK